jgi:deoxyadenosine/deoxycytidine kinase
MGDLVAIVGVSGVGKTSLVRALAAADRFETAFEQHAERPFQALFKADSRYALPNQIDYFLLRAEQEKELRASPRIGLIDGGLDLDYHGFTRLFHCRGFLTDPERDLCRRLYTLLRESLPPPERIVAMSAPGQIVRGRLTSRNRINITSAEDAALLERLIDEWLESLPPDHILRVDASSEDETYSKSVPFILEWLADWD